MDVKLTDFLSVTADIVSLLGVSLLTIAAAFNGIFRRNKDNFAIKVSLYIAYFFKAVLVFFCATILGVFCFDLMEIPVFLDREPIVLSISLVLLIFAVYVVIVWLVGSLIWTSSTRHVIGFLNSLGLRIEKLIPRLEILNAVYGSDTQTIDVTNVLIQRILDNKMTVIASNTLGGDPHHGIVKKLTVTYRFGNIPRSIVVNEGDTLRLPIDEA